MSTKNPSQFDATLTSKIEHEDSISAKRVIDVNNIVGSYWNRVETTLDSQENVTNIKFYLDSDFEKSRVEFNSDVSGSLNNKYFNLNSALNKTQYYVWYNVDSGGTDPAVVGKTGIEVPISSGDNEKIISFATKTVIASVAGTDFTVQDLEGAIEITNKVLGATDDISDNNTGFTFTVLAQGSSELLLDKDLTAPEGYKYVYDEVNRTVFLDRDCLFVDEDNSTSTPLNAGEVFYGPWTRRQCPEILVSPYADQDFSWYVQFANTELSTTLGQPVYTAGTAAGIDSSLKYDYEAGVTFGTPRRLIMGREWYRVVAVNTSGSNMTAFRLQTSLGQFNKLEFKLDSNIPLDSDAYLTRSVNTGLNPNNMYENTRQSGYVDAVSTNATLGSGGVFDSGIIDCEGYSQISTELRADQTGTLVGTWYADAAGTQALRSFTVPYVPNNDISWFSSVTFSRYIRLIYTNGATPQTEFHFWSKLDTSSKHGQMLSLEAFVPTNSLVNVNRTVNAGKNPDGVYANERQSGYYSTASSNTPLGIGASFTSDIVNVEEFSQVIGEFKADQVGTINGFWYADAAGTQLIRTFTSPYDPTDDLNWFATSTLAPYFQIQFVNTSGVAQTEFHFRFKLETQPQTGQMLKMESFVPANSIVTLNRSVIVGKRASDSTYVNVGTNDQGALQTSDFYTDVALGNYSDAKINTKFGRNPDIDTGSTPEDIWNNGGVYTGQPTTGSATTLDVDSSSGNDTSAGTGARTLRIYGLDGSYNEINEIITLNGTTAVTTVNSYWRVSRMEVVTAGSAEFNQGSITASWTGTPSQIFAVMPTGTNQSTLGADTVPAGKKRLVLGLKASMTRTSGSNGSANVGFMVRKENEAFQTKRNIEITNSLGYESIPKGGILLEEKTDMKWRVFDVSDNNTTIAVEFEFIDIEV